MSANVATNFPPQTYSSQFFLNTLTDDVGTPATSSKKRTKNPPDGAEPSNAVLDCFISTMHKKHLIFLLIILQLSCTAAQKKYSCSDASHASVRFFEDIKQLQRNQIPFSPNDNFVSFNAVTISRLETNDFIAHDSNQIRKLILNGKRIELIDKGAFNELFCVRYLLLQDNLISAIANGTFGGLYSLQELNLKGNFITEIPSGSFWNLKHLLRLDLSFNRLKNLHNDSLIYLRSLYELNLGFNLIVRLPGNFFAHTTRLNSLHLGNNKIILPDKSEYAGLSSLDVLDLQDNLIQTIGNQTLTDLPVTELNLMGNQIKLLNITDLPSNLELLNIAHNSFQCSYLQNLFDILELHYIKIILNNDIVSDLSPEKIGCLNGTSNITPPTTTSTQPPYFTKSRGTTTTEKSIIIPQEATPANVTNFDEEHLWKIEQENREVLKAVVDLKTVLVILIIIIVMFHIIDIMIRTNTCERFRRRFQRRPNNSIYYQSRFQDTSFPLLQR